MRRTFQRHHAHGAVLAHLLRRPRFLDAAVLAAARRQSVFDAAVDLGLGRGTAPLSALAHVAMSYAAGVF